MRANLERFSDVETNWLRDLGRPRCPACARHYRRRTSLCADGTGRTRCRTVECRPAADSGCTGNDRRHSSSPRAAGNGCFASTASHPRTARHASRRDRSPTRHPADAASGVRAAPAASHAGRRRAATSPPVDPLLAEVRRQLAEPAKGNVERADRAALAAFYAARNEPLLWVTSDGFTAKARHAMAEIRKADDWGLSASAFELPQLAQGTAAPDALAGAEIKLGLAALKYARHARGGRLDPAQISKDLDSEADPARSEGRAARPGRDRDARQLPARPEPEARAVPAAAPGPAEGTRRALHTPSR